MANQSFEGNLTGLNTTYIMIFKNVINTASLITSTFGLITYLTCFMYINSKLVLNSAMKNALKVYSVLISISYLIVFESAVCNSSDYMKLICKDNSTIDVVSYLDKEDE